MAPYIDISLRVPATIPIPEFLPLIQDVEAAGFDGAGILDSQLLCRDVFVTMGAAAAQTSRMTSIFGRHEPFLPTCIRTG